MSYPTIESYNGYVETEELENHYSLDPALFAPTPSILIADGRSRTAIEIVGCHLGYVVRVLPVLGNRLERFVDDIDWEHCCTASDGVNYLLNALGISTSRYRTSTTSTAEIREQHERRCVHDIALACDRETYTKPETGMDRVAKVTPEHPHPQWPFWELELPEFPFGYVITECGELIASASVRRNAGVFQDNLWTLGVGVDPEWRRQGLGRTVSAAATQEVLGLGGLALWNTQADNPGSLTIARSLGYKTVLYHIKIPVHGVESAVTG